MIHTYNFRCCVCGTEMTETNKANQCMSCMHQDIDLSKGIEVDIINQCKRCLRWETNKKKWMVAEWESRDLLGLCMKLIKIPKGGPRMKDGTFIYTEEHSRRIKVKLLLEQEVAGGCLIQQSHELEFTTRNKQCVDCERDFTPHTWNSVVQLRQKSEHARTFNQLEAALLKNKALERLVKVERQDQGIDFYFATKAGSMHFLDYLKTWVTGKEKHSKHLVSHNVNNCTYKFKYAICLELCPLSRGDLVCLPKKVSKSFGGYPRLLLVLRVRSSIHLLDPLNGRFYEISRELYWKNPFKPVLSYPQMREFLVMDDSSFPEITVAQTRDLGNVDDCLQECRAHFQVECGREVLAYDLINTVIPELDELNDDEKPDIVLVQNKNAKTVLVKPDGSPVKGQRTKGGSSVPDSSVPGNVSDMAEVIDPEEHDDIENMMQFIENAKDETKEEDEIGGNNIDSDEEWGPPTK